MHRCVAVCEQAYVYTGVSKCVSGCACRCVHTGALVEADLLVLLVLFRT